MVDDFALHVADITYKHEQKLFHGLINLHMTDSMSPATS